MKLSCDRCCMPSPHHAPLCADGWCAPDCEDHPTKEDIERGRNGRWDHHCPRGYDYFACADLCSFHSGEHRRFIPAGELREESNDKI